MYGAVSNHSNEKMEIVLQHKVGEDLIESVTVLVAALIQYPIYVNFYPIFLSRWLRTIWLVFIFQVSVLFFPFLPR